MERNQPQWDKPRWDATVARIGNQSPLLSALANLVGSTQRTITGQSGTP